MIFVGVGNVGSRYLGTVHPPISNKRSNEVLGSGNWGPRGQDQHFPILDGEKENQRKKGYNGKPEILTNSSWSLSGVPLQNAQPWVKRLFKKVLQKSQTHYTQEAV